MPTGRPRPSPSPLFLFSEIDEKDRRNKIDLLIGQVKRAAGNRDAGIDLDHLVEQARSKVRAEAMKLVPQIVHVAWMDLDARSREGFRTGEVRLLPWDSADPRLDFGEWSLNHLRVASAEATALLREEGVQVKIVDVEEEGWWFGHQLVLKLRF